MRRRNATVKTLVESAFAVLFALAFCVRSFGGATECVSAAATCNAQCDDPALYATSPEGHRLERANFKARCERSCSAGLASCNGQDSRVACNTFYFHCVGTCPWTVTAVDTYADVTVRFSDSFPYCGRACETGHSTCRAESKNSPYRDGTAPFDACAEMQGACYAHCMRGADSDTEFPDQCAKACAQGVTPCKAESGSKCDAFFHPCAVACPDVSYVSGERFQVDSADGDKCLDSCQAAREFCKR